MNHAPTLRQSRTRLLLGSGLLIGIGTADLCLTGGAGTAAALAAGASGSSMNTLMAGIGEKLGGLSESVVANMVSDEMGERMRNSPSNVLQNRDLERATGDAIALLLEETSEALKPGYDYPLIQPESQRGNLANLSRVASKYWLKPSDVPLSDNGSDHSDFVVDTSDLVNVLGKSARGGREGSPLSYTEWMRVLNYLVNCTHADGLDYPLSVRTKEIAAMRLKARFVRELRTVLKRDAKEGGGAYAGIVLAMLGETLEGIRELSKNKDARRPAEADVLENLQSAASEIRGYIPDLEKELEALSQEGQKAHEQRTKALNKLKSLSVQITEEHEEIKELIQAEAERTRNVIIELLEGGGGAFSVPLWERDSGPEYTPAENLLRDDDWETDPWGALLSIVNEQALEEYRAVLDDNEGSMSDRCEGRVWSESWSTYVEGLRHWVPVIDDRTGATIHTHIPSELRDSVSENKPLRFWIVAPPGAGKTTVLYRSYFELLGIRSAVPSKRANDAPLQGEVPIPMLVQPHLLKQEQVRRLDSAEGEARIPALAITWLENRRISATREQLATLSQSLLYNLESGKVVLFIDSFDELSRMRIHMGLTLDLLTRARRFVCATREETFRPDEVEGIRDSVVRISGAWDQDTAATYLASRLGDSSVSVRTFLREITQTGQPEWLLNPRYLTLLVDEVERSPIQNLLSAARRGQYSLLSALYGHAAQRLFLAGRRLAAEHPKFEVGPEFGASMRRKFETIATSQLLKGRHSISVSEVEGSLEWSLLCGQGTATDLLQPPHRQEESYHLRLKNFTLIDFFLARPIADEIWHENATIEYSHLWSSNLLAFLSAELRKPSRRSEQSQSSEPKESIEDIIEDRIWSSLDRIRLPDLPVDAPYRPAQIDGPDRFEAVNLIHLALRLLQDAEATDGRSAEEVRSALKISDACFEDLYLEGVDLHRVRFDECSFDRSFLRDARLDRAVFDTCSFRRANLRRVNAAFASFEYCTFDFHRLPKHNSPSVEGNETSHRMAVEETLVQEIELIGSGVSLEDFRAGGALMTRSRYLGEFGKRFFEAQSTFLGRGYRRAEEFYIKAIHSLLDEWVEEGPTDEPLYMIDLMAGGSNERLLDLMTETRYGRTYPTLHVLAIDRDTHQLIEVKEKVGPRFEIVPKEIDGTADLTRELRGTFPERPESAHLIIGKKALHELPPAHQRSLIRECFETLRPGGTLLLFADAPRSLSREGYQHLEDLKTPLRDRLNGKESDYSSLKSIYLDELTFGDSDDDVAMFCNLWVFLKDWANRNEHEVLHRYFSSATEIQRWAREAGFVEWQVLPEDEFGTSTFSYSLVARLFNEVGINRVGTYLKQSGGEIQEKDRPTVREALMGSERHSLFCSFAGRHLLSSDPEEKPTKLGKKLSAKRVKVDWRRVDRALGRLDLPPAYSRSSSFEFPVRILAFRKH